MINVKGLSKIIRVIHTCRKHVHVIAVILLMIMVFTGCDCFSNGEGIVVDSETQLPLDSVTVFGHVPDASAFEDEMMTDSSGAFNIHVTFGGKFFGGCEDMFIRFSKEGYTTKEVREPIDNIITLVKE